jgi:Rieske Fe-S protein
MVQDRTECPCAGASLDRRTALRAALGVVLGFPFVHTATAQDADPRSARPRQGDQLAHAEGERRGSLIVPGDLPLDGPQTKAFPFDPQAKVMRDGSRLNTVSLVRFDPGQLGEQSRERAADGVVAYSAICTHQGCEVSAWDAEMKALWCPCHDSKFDLRENGRVVGGPAPRRLAALPLRWVGGALTVAGGFTGPVGPKTR